MPINLLYRESSTETPPSEVKSKGNPLSSKEIDANFKSISNSHDKLASDIATANENISKNTDDIEDIKSRKNHAATTDTYGLGTGSLYGHLKVVDSGYSAAADSVAASPKYVDDVKTELVSSIDTKAKTDHASENDTYGLGTGSLYGHLKVVDGGSSSASNSIAASPKYVDDVKTELVSQIGTKSPTSHASSSNTYGLGTGSLYGHLKVVDSGSSGASESIAASPKYVSDSISSLNDSLTTEINKKSPISHASSDGTYGLGTTSSYGHVKISDSGSNAAADSVAASPKYVNDINTALTTAINGKAPTSHTSTSGTYGLGTSALYGHLKVVDSGSDAASTSVAASPKYVNDINTALTTAINGKAPSSHTHNYAGSSSAGGPATSANKVNTSLTFNNGGSGAASGTTFDGSTARTISYNTIGAAASSHTHSYLPLSGGTMTGSITGTTSAFKIPTLAQSWLGGKTGTVPIDITTQQNTSSYYPVMRIKDSGGNVFNLGGLGTSVGFYGYYASRTENGTDWNFTVNASTGNWECSGSLNVSGTLKQGGTAVSLNGHTHTYAGSSSPGGAATSANKVNASLTFNNGGSGAASGTTFDGSTARTISYNTIGAAASSHGHNYVPGSGSTFYSGNSGSAEHNCNSAITNGHYYYTSNGPSGLGESASDGALYVQSYSDAWVGQIAQDYRNGRLWVRGKNNGTWQSWRTMVDETTLEAVLDNLIAKY